MGIFGRGIIYTKRTLFYCHTCLDLEVAREEINKVSARTKSTVISEKQPL